MHTDRHFDAREKGWTKVVLKAFRRTSQEWQGRRGENINK